MTDKATTIPSFNPSGKKEVDEIKSRVESAIDYIRDMSAGDPRCKALSITKLEEASMWAVKSLFV
jgi:hypothetical protein